METKVTMGFNGVHHFLQTAEGKLSKPKTFREISTIKINGIWYCGFTDYFTGNGEVVLNSSEHLDRIMELIG